MESPYIWKSKTAASSLPLLFSYVREYTAGAALSFEEDSGWNLIRSKLLEEIWIGILVLYFIISLLREEEPFFCMSNTPPFDVIEYCFTKFFSDVALLVT